MCTILLIDDEPYIRKGLKSMIENSEVEATKIYEASNGEEGIKIISEHTPDIIMTDIRMPDIDGLELIQWIHTNYELPPIIIVISGYDEFNYAQKAMHYGVQEYLLKPVRKEELIRVLNHFIQQLRNEEQEYQSAHLHYVQSKEGIQILQEKYLNLLLTSYDKTHQKRIIDELNRLEIYFKEGAFNLIVADYRGLDESITNTERFIIQNKVEEVFQNIGMEHHIFCDAQKRIIILLWANTPILQEIQMKKIYENIKFNLKKNLNLDMFWGVCSNVGELSNINEAYKIALRSAMFKLFNPVEGIAFNKKLMTKRNIYTYFSGYSAKISSEVELGRKHRIIMLLTECFENLGSKQLSADEYEDFYHYFNNDVYNYFVKKGINIDDIFDEGEVFFKDPSKFWGIEEMKKYIQNYLFTISNIVTAYKQYSPNTKLVNQIIKYLNENYSDNINLNTVADHFKKNNSYLSVLFKKETGIKFVDFLANIRIEQAKKLLLNLDNKVSDIAAQVGYVNPKYFNVVFKKLVGMSPRQFRNRSI